MARVEDPRRIYVPEVGQHITFVYHAFFSGKMSGLFTPKILYKQHGDVDKVIFPNGYIFTCHLNTICISYAVADNDIAMVPASVRTILQWLLKNAQGFSVALSLVKMRSSSLNGYALKLKRSSISVNYA